MTNALIWLRRLEETSDSIKQGEELLKTLPQELTRAYKQREAYLAFLKGSFYINKGGNQKDVDLATKHFENSLAMREELGIKHEIAESLILKGFNLCIFKGELDRGLKYAERGLALAKESAKTYYVAISLFFTGKIYSLKGELDRSIRLQEQSLELYKELNNKSGMANVLNSLSNTYKVKGELNRALECTEQSIALYRDLGHLIYVAYGYDNLIQILIDKGDIERAQSSLHDLEQWNNQLKDKQINLIFLRDKALVLKTSLRARDRGNAEEILKQILEETGTYEGRYMALLNLCDLLLTELRMTNDLEVLDELTQFVGQLLELADKSHSYFI
ncbi:hypothetical protein LCGC14_1501660, partial [marine sediment metagenome]